MTKQKNLEAHVDRPCEDCPLKVEWQNEFVIMSERHLCSDVKQDIPYYSNTEKYDLYLRLKGTED